eukprot:c20805_g2_i2.p1 GENE.c20805_g2_i2~~c20805_g2_i2.p1  ORF type:complete len:270 (+),score=57.19 c20805_g2_i2:1-810(+)
MGWNCFLGTMRSCQYPQSVCDKFNAFTTTILVLVSAVQKLCRSSHIKEGVALYRLAVTREVTTFFFAVQPAGSPEQSPLPHFKRACACKCKSKQRVGTAEQMHLTSFKNAVEDLQNLTHPSTANTDAIQNHEHETNKTGPRIPWLSLFVESIVVVTCTAGDAVVQRQSYATVDNDLSVEGWNNTSNEERVGYKKIDCVEDLGPDCLYCEPRVPVLFVACWNGNLGCVSAVVDGEVDLEAEFNGWTAAAVARATGHEECAALIESKMTKH